MNIHVITFAYAVAEPLLETFAAADGPEITWHLFLHSQRPDVVAVCERLAERRNVQYYPYGTDRGLARSANEGLIDAQAAGADVVCQLCDDVLAAPGDLERLVDALHSAPRVAAVEGNCYVQAGGLWRASGFDAVAWNLATVRQIGYFDQNCWPLNYEDIDWKRRARLAGWTFVTCPDTHFTHRDLNPSHASPEFQAHFGRTQAYYVGKWSGDIGHEQYTRPFNDERYDLTIPAERVNNPYPAYQRKDIPV